MNNEDFTIENDVLIKCKGNKKIIQIPEGVRIINDDVFYGNKNIEKVILPSSVKIIRTSAFENCKNLTEINLENVEEIHKRCFCECCSLTKINLKKAINIEDYAFYKNKNLEKIIFSENLNYIGDYAVSFTKIKEINMYNVQHMGVFVYNDCPNLKKINIKNVKKIDGAIASFCEKLEELNLGISKNNDIVVVSNCINLRKINLHNTINVENFAYLYDEDNPSLIEITGPNIVCENGVVYNKDKSMLLLYLPGKQDQEFIIPQNVIKLCACSLEENSYIEKIIINNNIKIEELGICHCENLKEIEINSNIELEKLSICENNNLKKIDLRKTKIKQYNDDMISGKKGIKIILPNTTKTINIKSSENKQSEIISYGNPEIIGDKTNVKIINLETLINEGKSILKANNVFKEELR